MNCKEISEKLNELTNSPGYGSIEYSKWLEQNDFFQFLLDSGIDEVPLYVSSNGIFIYSVLIEKRHLKGDYVEDLMGWQCPPDSTWGYGYSFGVSGKPKKVFVHEPFDSHGSEILKKAKPLTFLRSYEGGIGQKTYVEFSQQFAHLHGLHFDKERNAYCRLNDEGDIDKIVQIYFEPEKILATIRRDVLNFHLFLSKSVLVRFFDVTRCYDWINYHEEGRKEKMINDQKNEIYARHGIIYEKEKPTAGWSRGFQIIRNRVPKGKMLKVLTRRYSEPEGYEKFITHDWKNKTVTECSCDPREVSSYFEKSSKPFQISPVFFKPEVLLKYKQDFDKYTLTERSISCRNSWHLKTYDINEAGQVHTYICYLGDLPHSEQLHWKQYNEKPKGSISSRAYQTDIKGEWGTFYSPLSALKGSLKKLMDLNSKLWICKDEKLFVQLNYVVSNSINEWSAEIDRLDKLVIEGLEHSYLKLLATSMNCYNVQLGTIKLLKEILVKTGINNTEVELIIAPFEDIHRFRTKFSGHVSVQDRDSIESSLISRFGSLKNHFRNLLERTHKAIETILELVNKGHLN